jgi:hypothetical protein
MVAKMWRLAVTASFLLLSIGSASAGWADPLVISHANAQLDSDSFKAVDRKVEAYITDTCKPDAVGGFFGFISQD